MHLPITKIIIYKHGLAFFQHEGEVEENNSVDFFFKSKDMNDVLKSFTIIDKQDKTHILVQTVNDNNNNSQISSKWFTGDTLLELATRFMMCV
jgi:hypothetical protein